MKKLNIDRRLLLGLIVFSCFQIYWAWTPKPKTVKAPPPAVDTFVPLGFTLVPIQIENHAELNSLIDNFAIVDLHKQGHPNVIATGVRLLRSPRNPEVFAVLIEQDKARKLISLYGAQFTVSVQSRDAKPAKRQPKRTIVRK